MENKIKIEHQGMGLIWFIGWLFTIGFLKLTFWEGVLGLAVWPYFLGKGIALLIGA